MSNFEIPLSVPELKGNEWKYVKECLDTNWVSSAGKYVDKFEEVVADYAGADYAVATVNGTAALHISLLVAGVETNDEVITPSLTFVAPANAVRYVDAWPTFMDADQYYQLEVGKMVDFLENECEWKNGELINSHTGRKISAILPVDVMGHPVDMDPINEIAEKYNLTVIEDATEALGAEYKGRKVGTLGDIGVYSFNGNKLITTGGGGMIVTDNHEWAEKARYLTTQAKDDPLEYIHKEIGYNYRLTNIQAAMGVAQMEQLDGFVEKKRENAKRYTEELTEIEGITPPKEAPWAQSTYWLYTVLLNKDNYGMDSRELMDKMRENGIQVRPFWHPIHSLEPFEGTYPHEINSAEKFYEKSLSLPSSVGLTTDELEIVTKWLV